MKKIILLLLLGYWSPAFAQTVPKLADVKLEQEADYRTAEPVVLRAATYMLSAPFEKNDPNRVNAVPLLLKWMSDTPDYSFAVDETATKIAKDNNDLLGLYMAAMTKYSLENKASAKDAKLVKLNATKMLLAYCENPRNKVQMTEELKRLADANKKGKLEQAL